MKAIFVIICITFFCGIGYISWRIKREINYKFMYESLVVEQIHKETDTKFNNIEQRLNKLENRR